MFYPPVWVVWWSGAPSALGWLTVGHLLWGGLGVYRAAALGRLGLAGRRRSPRRSTRLRRSSWRTRSRAIIRTSGPPAGIPGLSGPTASNAGRPAARAAVLADHPRPHVPGGSSAGMVSAGSGLVGLEPVRRGESGASKAHATPRVKLLALAGVAAWSIGLAAVELAPQLAVRPWVLGNGNHLERFEAAIPRRYHLHASECLAVAQPDALGGAIRLFRRRQLLGNPVLDRAGAAVPGV